MECGSWETSGLLYTSDELEGKEKEVYEQHLAECETCRNALQRYTEEKQTLFGVEILAEETGAELDRKVRDLWTPPVVPTTSFFLFPAVLKRSVLAVFFLAIGLGGGMYVAYNIGQGEQTDATARGNVIPSQSPNMASEVPGPQIHAAADSLGTVHSPDSGAKGPAKSRTPISSEGVIPVDQQR